MQTRAIKKSTSLSKAKTGASKTTNKVNLRQSSAEAESQRLLCVLGSNVRLSQQSNLRPNQSIPIAFEPGCGYLRVETYASDRVQEGGSPIHPLPDVPTDRRIEIFKAGVATPVFRRTFGRADIENGFAKAEYYIDPSSDRGNWTVRVTHVDVNRNHPAQLFEVNVDYPTGRSVQSKTTYTGPHWWFWEALKNVFDDITIHLHYGENASWIRSPLLGERSFTAPEIRNTGIYDVNSILPPNSTQHRFTLVNGESGGNLVIRFQFEEQGREFVAVRSGGYHGHMWSMLLTVTLPLCAESGRVTYRASGVHATFDFDMDLANIPESWFGVHDQVRDAFQRETENQFRSYGTRMALSELLNSYAYGELECPPEPLPCTTDAKKAYYRIHRIWTVDDGLGIEYYHPPTTRPRLTLPSPD